MHGNADSGVRHNWLPHLAAGSAGRDYVDSWRQVLSGRYKYPKKEVQLDVS